MALYSGASFHALAMLWGQIAITSIQLMTHFSNDYFDLRADRANLTPTNWSGGSRVLVEKKLHPRTALLTALVFASTALCAMLILSLFIRPGMGTFMLLFTALCLAWFYSAPPLRLHSRGLGELTTAVVVTLLTPLTGYYLQMGAISLLPLLAVVPLCCFQGAMLLAIEFPDAEGDRLDNKQTLVVRLGEKSAAGLYAALLLLAYASLPVLIVLGLPLIAGLALMLVSPLAVLLLWRVSRGDWQEPTRWNAFSFYTIVLLMTASAAEVGAFVLLMGLR